VQSFAGKSGGNYYFHKKYDAKKHPHPKVATSKLTTEQIQQFEQLLQHKQDPNSLLVCYGQNLRS